MRTSPEFVAERSANPRSRKFQRRLPLPECLDTGMARQVAKAGNGVYSRRSELGGWQLRCPFRWREPGPAWRPARIDRLPVGTVWILFASGADARVASPRLGKSRDSRPDCSPQVGA